MNGSKNGVVTLNRRDAMKAVVGVGLAPLLSQDRASAEVASQRDWNLDADWRFSLGDIPGADKADFNDGAWRTIQLPHDWSIEDLPAHPESTGASAVWADCNCPSRVGPFDRDRSEGKGSTGWVVGGIGWYRKSLPLELLGAASQFELRFDGVYRHADVWINGHALGHHPYGYTPFAYDITPFVRRDGKNIIAVRVSNEGKNSRWYSGSGIYRHVWITATGDTRVPQWGIAITTPTVSPESATVKVSVRVENRGQAARDVVVRIRLLGPGGTVAPEAITKRVPGAGDATVELSIPVPRPQLWSSATPNLYRAEVELLADGRTVDRTTTTFGIRKIEVNAEHGLSINGDPVKLRGGCLHHDNGVLGAAAFDRAEERRVELMKANGFNAIRCSHNPPSPAFLDACDRLGLLVIDEAFDMWAVQKNPHDYHLDFKEWWRRDLDSMVLRDRNHPSVIFWSIGNEIPERADPAGVALAKELSERVRELDDTRPVTAAVPPFFELGRQRPWTDSDAAFQHLDVCGYNYLWREYEPDHARAPKRVMMGTESFPLLAFENWQQVEKHPFVLGDFVWTAMDYLGESSLGNARLNALPSPFAKPDSNIMPASLASAGFPPGAVFGMAEYPWFNAYCGDIDLIGEKKPQSYYRDVVWGRSKLEMAVQRPLPEGRKEQFSFWGWSDELRSWTWPASVGRPLAVRVYSTGDQVRLLLNGKEIEVKSVSAATRFTAEFTVPYAPGELKAIALKAGQKIAELAFITTGAPAALRLRADRQNIHGSGDLSYITVEVLDSAGRLVPDAVVPVTFKVGGAGEIAGVGNGNPKEMASFRSPKRNTYHGQCLAVIRNNSAAGAISVEAASEGLRSVQLQLRAG